MLFEIYSNSYHPKIIEDILKNVQKTSAFVWIRLYKLMVKKTRLKMKNKSHRYDINRPRPRHG